LIKTFYLIELALGEAGGSAFAFPPDGIPGGGKVSGPR